MDLATSPIPPRRFSNEIFALILAQADVGTLSKCSRVCLAFLEISGPLLYRDIVIDKEGQIQKLFCDQYSPSSSAISPYLSLSQTKTFTILHENSSALKLSTSRFPNGLPLQIDLLALRPTFVHRSSNEFFFMLRTKHVNRMEVCLAFNPVSFIAQYPTTEPFPDDEEGENQGEPTYRWQGFALRQEEAHRPLPWSRLEKVLYDGCYFVFGPVGDDASGFAPLSFQPNSSNGLRITYDLSSLKDALLFAGEAFVDLDEEAVGEGEVYFLDSGVTVLEIVVKNKKIEESLKPPMLDLLPERHATKLLVTVRDPTLLAFESKSRCVRLKLFCHHLSRRLSFGRRICFPPHSIKRHLTSTLLASPPPSRRNSESSIDGRPIVQPSTCSSRSVSTVISPSSTQTRSVASLPSKYRCGGKEEHAARDKTRKRNNACSARTRLQRAKVKASADGRAALHFFLETGLIASALPSSGAARFKSGGQVQTSRPASNYSDLYQTSQKTTPLSSSLLKPTTTSSSLPSSTVPNLPPPSLPPSPFDPAQMPSLPTNASLDGVSPPAQRKGVYKIASIPADGIGPEVINAGIEVLKALSKQLGTFELDFEHFDSWNSETYKKTGRYMPDDALDTLRKFDAIFFGAVGAPDVPDHISLWSLRLAICQPLQQYANVRRTRILPGTTSPLSNVKTGDLDWVIVRENSEGEYAGHGGRSHIGYDHEVATEISIFTRTAVRRIARFAFQTAQSRPRKMLCYVTKSNAQRNGLVMWDEIMNEVAKEFPDVKLDHMLVDAMTVRMVQDPRSLDTIVATNLHADILSDLAAALAGSIGIGPTANLDPSRKNPSMFEPIHGSAFDITGKGVANPVATFWTAAEMLDWLGEEEAAKKLMDAVEKVCVAGIMTKDLGGTANTKEVTAAVVAEIRRG